MKQIFETMVIVCLMIISLLLNLNMITTNLEITEARNFHANAVEEIQASQFNQDVINSKIAEAHADGRDWVLEVKDVTVYEDRKDVKVTLKYKIAEFPFRESEYRTIVGYAR